MADEMWYNAIVGSERGCFVSSAANGIMTPSEYVLFGQTAPHRIAWTLSPAIWSDAIGNAILCGAVCIMGTSKLQEKTKNRLRLLLGDFEIIENYRPDWLLNPETDQPMEIDFWLPEAEIAIEVQGRQHYEFVSHFHSSVEDFQKQMQRDELKKSLCKERGVELYEIFGPRDIDGLIEAIRKRRKDIAFQLLKRNTAIKSLSYYAARLFVLDQEKVKTKSQKLHKQQKMGKMLQRMVHISEKYGIAIKSIEPDFGISKIELAFNNKPIVEVQKLDKRGRPVRTVKAAVMSVYDDVAHLRWFARQDEQQYMDMDFDMLSGFQMPRDVSNWRIKMKSIGRRGAKVDWFPGASCHIERNQDD